MDHFSGAHQPHPLRRMAAAVSELVKDVEDVDPVFMSPDDRAAVLGELAGLEDRLHLLSLAVMQASGDLPARPGSGTSPPGGSPPSVATAPPPAATCTWPTHSTSGGA